MKLLVCISNYGPDQLFYLHQVLAGYDSMEQFEIDILVHTTVPIPVQRYSTPITQVLCDQSIKKDLAVQHRQVMLERQNDYDLFIYSENDILITEQNLIAFCRETARLPEPYAVGFLRYERHRTHLDDPELYLPDAHPFKPVYKGHVNLAGTVCFELINKHQGCFVLTRRQLQIAIASGRFNRFIPDCPLNLEAGASTVYFFCGLTKVIPRASMDELLVHHLSDKYVNLTAPPWCHAPPHTVNSLKRMVDEAMQTSC